MSTYYLQHHGVKGMKWGVRRYQNKDGSLTPAGKRRLKRYESRLNEVNDRILKDRALARQVRKDDPAAPMELRALSERVGGQIQSGKRIVQKMQAEGLISDKKTFHQYNAEYETKKINDCRKYVSQKYGIKDVTDDDVSYFLAAYLYGAI